MTKPLTSDIRCDNCAAFMGKSRGVVPVRGVVCNDPLCSYQPDFNMDLVRDSYIVSLAQDGVKVTEVAEAAGVSRQRVYQIFNRWKQGG